MCSIYKCYLKKKLYLQYIQMLIEINMYTIKGKIEDYDTD